MENLELKLTGSSQGATSAIDKVITKLNGLSRVTAQLDGITAVLGKLPSNDKLAVLATGLTALAGVQKLNLTKTDATNIGALATAANIAKTESAQNLVRMATGLNALAAVSKLQVNSTTGKTITSIAEALSQVDSTTAYKSSVLSKGLRELSLIPPIRLGSVGKNIGLLVTSLKDVDVSLEKKAQMLARSLKPFEKMQKTNLGSYLNPLAKLPIVLSSLKGFTNIDLHQTAAGAERLVKALAPLAKLQSGGGRRGYISGGQGVFGLLASPVGNFAALSAITLRISGALGNWVKQLNAYVENINLFTVAMGDFARKAMDYSNQVEKSLGIDTSRWIRDWGVFKQILSGFGVDDERAYKMSKVLNQLSYDAASFFNLPFDQAVQKFQSGIAGELEPLRRIGYALDVATLQQVAYRHGIDQTVQSMTQAQKAQLRFQAIFEQSKNVMGDLSRTLLTPANAMRVLKTQLEQLTRALGSLFIPMLMQVIPYVIAFVQVLTAAIKAIAKLIGFEMPQIDYSSMGKGLGGVGNQIDDIGEGLGDATSKAKEFKNFLAGFDEMVVIPSQADSSKGGSGTGVGMGGELFNLPTPDYDFLGKGMGVIDKLKKKLQDFIDFIVGIYDYLKPFFNNLAESLGIIALGTAIGKILEKIPLIGTALKQLVTGGAFVLGGVNLSYGTAFDAAYDYTMGKIDATQMVINTFLGWLGGTFLTAIGLKMIKMSSLVGGGLDTLITTIYVWWQDKLIPFFKGLFSDWRIWAAAAIISAIAAVIGHVRGKIAAQRDQILQNMFGDRVLTDDELREWLFPFLNNEYHAEVKAFIDAKVDVEKSIANVNEAIQNISKDLTLVKVGIGVERDTFINDVNTLIDETRTLVANQLIVAKLSISTFLNTQEGTDGAAAVRTASARFLGWDAELKQIGADMNALIEQGFGEYGWTDKTFEDEFDKLMEKYKLVQEKIRAYQNEINTSALEAKLGNLSFEDYSGKISLESIKKGYEQYMTEAQKTIDGYAEEFGILKANARLDLENGEIDQSQFDSRMAEAKRSFQEKMMAVNKDFYVELYSRVNVTLDGHMEEGVNNAVGQVNDMFLAAAQINGTYATNEVGEMVYEITDKFGEEMIWGVTDAFRNADAPVRDAAGIIWKSIGEVLHDDSLKIIKEAAENGAQIPVELGRGLLDTAAMGALAGDAESVAVIAGSLLFENPEFLKLLERGSIEGAGITEDMAMGMLAVLPDVLKTLDDDLVKPLIDFFSKLGIDLPTVLGDSLNEGKNEATDKAAELGRELIEKFDSAIFNSDGTPKVSANEWITEVIAILQRGNTPISTEARALAELINSAFGGEYQKILDNTDAFIRYLQGKLTLSELKVLIDLEVGNVAPELQQVVQSARGSRFTNTSGIVNPHGNTALPYATGGFPSYGDLFIANEAGPEFVGSFGNKTAVVNNYQIEAGVARGVRAGIGGAMVRNNDPNDSAPSKSDLAQMMMAAVMMVVDAIEANSEKNIVLDREKLATVATRMARRDNIVRG